MRPVEVKERRCIVCGDAAVQSHIFPRALMHDQKADSKELWGLDSGRPGFVGMQSGFSARFLCAAHEGRFAEADRYAVDFCRGFKQRARLSYMGMAYEVPNPKPSLLLDFAFACIWRAIAAVGSPSLGPYEGHLRNHLFGEDRRDYDLLITKTGHVDPWGEDTNISVLPHGLKLDGRRCSRFTLAGFHWMVKLDQVPFSETFRLLRANARDPLVVLTREAKLLSEDPDLDVFKRREVGPRRRNLF